MPTIQVPLQSWTEIPELRKSKTFRSLADEAKALAAEAKHVKARREELSLELYDILDEVLDDEVKSIEFEGATLTKRAGGKTKKLNKKKLMATPIKCTKCRTSNHVTVDVIDKCSDESDRRPGVSIKLADDEEGED